MSTRRKVIARLGSEFALEGGGHARLLAPPLIGDDVEVDETGTIVLVHHVRVAHGYDNREAFAGGPER